MSDTEDGARHENTDEGDDEAGTDVMNNNYRRQRAHRNQKTHLHNISLPCVLYSKKDIEIMDDRDKQTTVERTFHIEISKEGDVDIAEQEDDIAAVCHLSQEQGLGLKTDEHIVCTAEAIHGSDVQKLGVMVKIINGIGETLSWMDKRIQDRLVGAENKIDISMSEFNKSVGKLREVIERVDETSSNIGAKYARETQDHDTQTDVEPAPSGTCGGGEKLLHRNSTQEFSLSQVDEDVPDSTDVETNQIFTDLTDKCKSVVDRNEETYDISSASKMERGIETANDIGYNTAEEKCTKRDMLQEPTRKTTELDWQIDHDAWLSCLRMCDQQLGQNLLKERILPDQQMLDKLCSVFGRTSKLVSSVCSSICTFLRETLSEQSLDIWPAYNYNKMCHEKDRNNITFVVIKENSNDLDLDVVYNTYEREAYKCSSERSEVNKLEYTDTDTSAEVLADLTNCVNEKSVSLMDTHSKLTMVSASCKISKGHNTSSRNTQNTPCIVLYAHIKGFVPLDEEPFPEQIGKYPVDVREAVFKTFVGGPPNEYHENLRMGCAIRNSNIDYYGHCLAGTLGGFLDHPTYGLCCITCAHVLCSDLNDIQHHQNGLKHWTINDQPIQVFQPCCKGSPPFGHLVCAVYKVGGAGYSGVDVALVKIDSRHPVDGHFPDTLKSDQTGFSAARPMVYYNGKVCDREKLNMGSVVIKYGCSTEITRGVFRLKCGAVRKSHAVGQHQDLGFLLHNQIEILSAGEDAFAEQGDSGAFVFTEENEALTLIGLLEGGMGDGRYIVTPIQDIIKALDLPLEGTLKTFDKNGTPLSPLSDRLQPPRVTFRCSTPSLPRLARTSRSDSAISVSTSLSDDTSLVLTLVEEKLKATDEDITQELAKHASEIKQELSQSFDKKLASIKSDLKQEIKRSHDSIERRMEEQNNIMQQILGQLARPVNK